MDPPEHPGIVRAELLPPVLLGVAVPVDPPLVVILVPGHDGPGAATPDKVTCPVVKIAVVFVVMAKTEQMS